MPPWPPMGEPSAWTCAPSCASNAVICRPAIWDPSSPAGSRNVIRVNAMNETNPSDDCEPSEPSWRPPKPNSPEPEPPSDEQEPAGDAAEWESFLQQFAERAMAEITPHEWADLRSVKATRYEPGCYQVQISRADDPDPSVRLTWMPGRILLSEVLKITEENALALPLPSVRQSLKWKVEAPSPGQIPGRAAPESAPQWVHLNSEEQREQHEHKQAWETYVRPHTQQANQKEKSRLPATLADEEMLAFAAMQDIQARRLSTKTAPQQTITTALEAAAEKLRSAHAR